MLHTETVRLLMDHSLRNMSPQSGSSTRINQIRVLLQQQSRPHECRYRAVPIPNGTRHMDSYTVLSSIGFDGSLMSQYVGTTMYYTDKWPHLLHLWSSRTSTMSVCASFFGTEKLNRKNTKTKQFINPKYGLSIQEAITLHDKVSACCLLTSACCSAPPPLPFYPSPSSLCPRRHQFIIACHKHIHKSM